METAKNSHPSKTPNQNTGSDVVPLEDMDSNNQRKDARAETPKEEERDAEVENVPDSTVPAADVLDGQVAPHKHRSNTVGPQKKQWIVDFGTVSKASAVAIKSRTPLIQGLFAQGTSDKTPVTEGGSLEGLKQALETYAVPVDLTWKWAEEGEAHTLEESWTKLVHSHWMMSKTQRHQQEALWEFLHTELTYINKMIIVTDLVMAALSNLHQHGYLLEVTSEKLFSNLPSILEAHQRFWQDVMCPMLQMARKEGRPFDPLMLEPGCLQFPERFPSYFEYCLEEEKAVDFTRRQMESNPHFNAFLAWVETHPQCSRMRLGDMQAKPHQRITKYPLLLKAVLKSTEDSETQDSLKRMLSSVNNFVDNINNHLVQRDEELALFQCAQRIEGYDVMKGMSEEIDKHVREFCQFDLMSPVRGVGPEIIRKLLLEDTIKIRGRKDSKVEAVLLLFSDVVLVTKSQRKSEKLKVVRPPLALDRTRCSALKDGNSFVLVEVSDLGCAVSVYAVATSSPESCSAWVSAIKSAQDSLRTQRASGVSVGPEVVLMDTFESDSMAEVRQDQSESSVNPALDTAAVNPMENQSEGSITPQQLTEEITSAENVDAELQGKRCKLSEFRSQSMYGNLGQQVRSTPREGMLSQPGSRKNSEGKLWESAEIFVPGIHERRVTWSQSHQTASNKLQHGRTPSSRDTTSADRPITPHTLLLSGCTEEAIISSETAPSTFSVITEYVSVEPVGQSIYLRVESAQQSVRSNKSNQSEGNQSRRDSWYSLSGEDESLIESRRFSRKLKSPRLRRRRQINNQTNTEPPASHRGSVDNGQAPTGLPRNTTSSSNSDSDSSHRQHGKQAEGSHRVLKLGSLKKNRGVLWMVDQQDRLSPDLNTFSEPELPRRAPQKKPHKPPLKTQRSSSIPEAIFQGPLVRSPPKKHLRPPPAPSPPPSYFQLKDSPLESLLERAKGREKGREGAKNGGRKEEKPATPPDRSPSSTFSTTSSSLPSDGDRETEGEEMNPKRLRVAGLSHGWREGNVDGSDDERKSSPAYPEGASVDWPGWCFDDKEITHFLSPNDDESWGELEKTLTSMDFSHKGPPEESQCSEV
ncbi:pleckstrin homology domain-containing family G member 6 isoform X1 [Alosa sapidissima]|uniref:pleckstrin homology domain-containing family G member 6 isoform X1 n=1 Tax=Alosa sapidissima TaxID=34773 RepID=UPI001C082CF0|nr:pleckstrin homology domain-containing family G member 6 isoform X1 [Alosa sapidissima]